MNTVPTRPVTACFVVACALALGACSTTDQVARDQASAAMNAAARAQQTADQALATANDTKAELDRVERSFNTTLRK